MDRTLTLQGINGKLVVIETAGEDNIGLVHARTPPDSAGPWEQIHEQKLGPGRFALFDRPHTSGLSNVFNVIPDGNWSPTRTPHAVEVDVLVTVAV